MQDCSYHRTANWKWYSNYCFVSSNFASYFWYFLNNLPEFQSVVFLVGGNKLPRVVDGTMLGLRERSMGNLFIRLKMSPQQDGQCFNYSRRVCSRESRRWWFSHTFIIDPELPVLDIGSAFRLAESRFVDSIHASPPFISSISLAGGACNVEALRRASAQPYGPVPQPETILAVIDFNTSLCIQWIR